MSQDRSQSHERAREAPPKPRDRERTQDRPAERPSTDPRSLSDAMGDKARKANANAAPAVQVQETVVTAGKAGEKNITVTWHDIWIGNAKPCYFDIATLPGHGLEVTVEQLAYKKTYTGTGSLTTQPVPVVPIGTKFTIASRDTTTGETVDQWGIWIDMSGRGGGMSLWALIKKLLWKGA